MKARPPKDELYRLYWEEKSSLSEIGRRLGFDRKTIYRWLKGFGIPIRSKSAGLKTYHSQRSDFPKAQFLDLYRGGKSDCQISKILGIKRGKIKYQRRKMGLPPHQPKRHIDTSVLKLNNLSEKGAWFIGFHAADGYLRRRRDGGFSWSFHTTPDYESDLKDVKRIVESLFSFSPPLTVYLELNGKMSIQVHGTGLSILHQVYSYPIGEKTHNVRVPSKIFSLSPDLIAAFLRGVFDGDGCMGCYKVPNKRAYSLSCNFSSGSVLFLEDLRQLMKTFGINPSERVLTYRDERSKELYYKLLIQQQEDVKNLANLLLSVSTGLLRKASQIQNALQIRLNYEMEELAEKVAKNSV